MPCNTVTEVTKLDLRKALPEALANALQAQGFNPVLQGETLTARNNRTGAVARWDRVNGLVITGNAGTVNAPEITKAYTKSVVELAAAKNGWRVKYDATDGNKMQVIRGYK